MDIKDTGTVNGVNLIVLAIAHLSDLKEALSCVLIFVSIGYTLHMWRKSRNSKSNPAKSDDTKTSGK